MNTLCRGQVSQGLATNSLSLLRWSRVCRSFGVDAGTENPLVVRHLLAIYFTNRHYGLCNSKLFQTYSGNSPNFSRSSFPRYQIFFKFCFHILYTQEMTCADVICQNFRGYLITINNRYFQVLP